MKSADINLDQAQEVFDISPVISPELAVFPGDVPFSRQVLLDQTKGDHLCLSSMTSTLHIGAHADAPLHYGKEAESIDVRSVLPYMGSCQVIEVKTPYGERILPHHFDVHAIRAPRVLFKTKSFDPHQWSEGFNSLSPETIELLVEKSVLLVGIDTPSVDPHDSKALESHQALLKHNLSVLEGLDLEDVPEGEYQLIALPLKIQGADASPVRAILLR